LYFERFSVSMSDGPPALLWGASGQMSYRGVRWALDGVAGNGVALRF
jgi:hypothetical protein